MAQTIPLATRTPTKRLEQLVLSRSDFPLGITAAEILSYVDNATAGSTVTIKPQIIVDETEYVILTETLDGYENSGRQSIVGVTVDPAIRTGSLPDLTLDSLLNLSTKTFKANAQVGDYIASVYAPADWKVELVESFNDSLTLVGRHLIAARTMQVGLSGTVRLRVTRRDGLVIVDRVFTVSIGALTGIPFNALMLNGTPLTLNGLVLTLN